MTPFISRFVFDGHLVTKAPETPEEFAALATRLSEEFKALVDNLPDDYYAIVPTADDPLTILYMNQDPGTHKGRLKVWLTITRYVKRTPWLYLRSYA